MSDQRICPACLEPETDDAPHDMQCHYECAVLQINELHLAVHTRDARWQAFREWLASVHDELEPLDRRDRAVAMAFEALCKMAELERELLGEKK